MRAAHLVRRVAEATVRTTAAAYDVVRPAGPGIVVLCYHRVGGGSASSVDLPAGLFDEQMALLAASGRACSLDDALDRLTGSDVESASANPVVVTFDDGTADWLDIALPILERHGVPATFYVATGYVGGSEPLPGGAPAIGWPALRDLAASPLVTIGSHTHSHLLLDRATRDEAATDIDRSIELLAEQVEGTCDHFAYPKGLLGSDAAQREVQARFRSAAVGTSHTNEYGATDPHRLARTPVQVRDGMRWFERKLAGGLRLEDDLRGLVNRRRYAGATN